MVFTITDLFVSYDNRATRGVNVRRRTHDGADDAGNEVRFMGVQGELSIIREVLCKMHGELLRLEH